MGTNSDIEITQVCQDLCELELWSGGRRGHIWPISGSIIMAQKARNDVLVVVTCNLCYHPSTVYEGFSTG